MSVALSCLLGVAFCDDCAADALRVESEPPKITVAVTIAARIKVFMIFPVGEPPGPHLSAFEDYFMRQSDAENDDM